MRRHRSNHELIDRKHLPQNGGDVFWSATHDQLEVMKLYGVNDKGINHNEFRRRLSYYGHNEIQAAESLRWYHVLYRNVKDPLNVLLFSLGLISAVTKDFKAATLITIMLVMSTALRFIQELRADKASESLRAMVRTVATVIRLGHKSEVALRMIVPGDIIHLSAGDMVPADVRLIDSRDLFVNQASLTGESLPVEKHATTITGATKNPLDLPNICFMGTNVGSGTATAIVIATGSSTKFGRLAVDVAARPETPTSFDRGIEKYTWMMIKFVCIMVPAVFLINGYFKHDWLQAFLFALAVAVGLTPELLPVIVTVNLSRGAYGMSRKKVIVKRLNAIQNFGAMDVLCTDKTGTLTEGKVVLTRHVNIFGLEDEKLINYAYLNSYYQTGFKNLIDEAIINHDRALNERRAKEYKKVDELPFDFKRRRMSIVAEEPNGDHILICKGAVEEVMSQCKDVLDGNKIISLGAFHKTNKDDLVDQMNREGFRLIALAIKRLPPSRQVYTSADEHGMTLVGFLAFFDPPKQTAAKAIQELENHGVKIKILTGDNEKVTKKICDEVGLVVEGFLLGSQIAEMDDDQLKAAVHKTTIFSKLEPIHKERVIKAIQSRGHVVGFLGDGINDAPAFKAADVGISVNSAVDIAKESSDIILLEQSLMVLMDGVMEGRKAFGNIVKYIKMMASSNFGNMFSVVGGSIFLPFLPMLPLQVITNNLLYDISQASIPTDAVDQTYLEKPRQWKIDRIRKFILWLGPVSSLFDYATFFLLLYIFNAWADPVLFRTGWFVESLFTQTLIVHIIRTDKIPFFQSRASWPLTFMTLLVCSFGAWLPYSPVADTLGLRPLPLLFWGYLAIFVLVYFVLTQFVKVRFIKKYGWD